MQSNKQRYTEPIVKSKLYFINVDNAIYGQRFYFNEDPRFDKCNLQKITTFTADESNGGLGQAFSPFISINQSIVLPSTKTANLFTITMVNYNDEEILKDWPYANLIYYSSNALFLPRRPVFQYFHNIEINLHKSYITCYGNVTPNPSGFPFHAAIQLNLL